MTDENLDKKNKTTIAIVFVVLIVPIMFGIHVITNPIKPIQKVQKNQALEDYLEQEKIKRDQLNKNYSLDEWEKILTNNYSENTWIEVINKNTQAEYFQIFEDEGQIHVSATVKEYWSIKSFMKDASDILKIIRINPKITGEIIITTTMPYVDKYGNNFSRHVITAIFPVSEIRKVNFDQVPRELVFANATKFIINDPGVRKDVSKICASDNLFRSVRVMCSSI
jgi:hypothetical protein